MRKPNLIYILADDMGYGDISALNEHCGFKTPNLDEMAENGVCFTDAHATGRRLYAVPLWNSYRPL